MESHTYTIKTLIFVSITMFLKFFNGFIHALLYYNGILQISLLTLSNVCFLLATFLSK